MGDYQKYNPYNLVFILLGTVCSIMVAVFLNDIVQKRAKKTYQTIILLPI